MVIYNHITRNLSRAPGRPADFLNHALKIQKFRALTEVTGFLIYELGWEMSTSFQQINSNILLVSAEQLYIYNKSM